MDRRNSGRNFGNDKRNHESNFETKKDNEDQRNVVSEPWEELVEIFVKELTIGSKEKLDDAKKERLKSRIEFGSPKLNWSCSQHHNLKLLLEIELWVARLREDVSKIFEMLIKLVIDPT